jgi:hypothetical protein
VKLALVMVVTLLLCGCSQSGTQPSPTAPAPPAPGPPPTPTPGPPVWLLGYVVNSDGVCVEGATVEVVGGQGAGQSVPQKTPCDAWDYANGFEFHDLMPGVAMTLSASAPGWSTCAYSVTPHGGGQSAVILELSKPGVACRKSIWWPD